MYAHESTISSVPDPEEQPTLSLTEVALILGVSRSTAYAHAGGLPIVMICGQRRVLTADLREMLGLPRHRERGAAA